MTENCPMASWTSVDFSCNGYVFQGPQFDLYNETHLGNIILKSILTLLFLIVNFYSDIPVKKKKKKSLAINAQNYFLIFSRCSGMGIEFFYVTNAQKQYSVLLVGRNKVDRSCFKIEQVFSRCVKWEKTNKVDRMGIKARRVPQNIQTCQNLTFA